ncbi:hypothetical protein PROFUN_06102 [Planoprotostelium fungivorum]|uniref:NAD(+) kinase n=1 Tax=Planoprotostelium fungivorum TaxID=1890364 RepID=A0A2P6NPU7_9EUKA|nr:hypothetical protein PROFUN_06102 [Planoprotostelium fungivorum]
MKVTLDTEDILHDLTILFAIFLVYITFQHRAWITSVISRFTTTSTTRKPSSTPKSNRRKDEVSSNNKDKKGSRVGIRLTGVDENEEKKTETDTNRCKGEHQSSIEKSDYEILYRKPPSKIRLEWDSRPTKIYVIKKWHDDTATKSLAELSKWLMDERSITVYADKDALKDLPQLSNIEELEDASHHIDLILCLGGDGTVLHACSLFEENVPPIVAFNFGSMGFLTPFEFKRYKEDLNSVLEGQCYAKIRLRLECSVVDESGNTTQTHQVFNEVVLDRGSSPYLSSLNCYCDDRMITNVQADGVIVATATGSTAYSLSAGGSLIHPQLPAMLFTPICPHSLSFRPVVMPASVTLKIEVPSDSSASAFVSFDGRHRTELSKGMSVSIKVSNWPVPTVVRTMEIGDWFHSLAVHLNWNQRVQQKSK